MEVLLTVSVLVVKRPETKVTSPVGTFTGPTLLNVFPPAETVQAPVANTKPLFARRFPLAVKLLKEPAPEEELMKKPVPPAPVER